MIAIVAGLLAGLGAPIAGAAMPPGATGAPPPAAGVCTLPTGWAAVARSRPRFVVFGEMHGTVEAPALVGDVACALAAEGRRVLVAIEHPSRFDPAIQAAWRLPPARFGPALLAAGWAGRDYGTASRAMVDLVVRLHAAKAAGRPIALVAFNGVRDAAQRARLAPLTDAALHEAAQADAIRSAAGAGRYDDVLVLVGNVHARKAPVTHDGVEYEPMAMRLARAGRAVSLNARTAGGTEWGCLLRPGFVFVPGRPMPEGAIGCGVHPVRADPAAAAARSVTLGPAPGGGSDRGYDGVFDLGRVTASPPAVARGS